MDPNGLEVWPGNFLAAAREFLVACQHAKGEICSMKLHLIRMLWTEKPNSGTRYSGTQIGRLGAWLKNGTIPDDGRGKMKRTSFVYGVIVTIAVFCLGAISAQSQNVHCIRAGATGAGTGNNWTDAYGDIPATLVRGDTYYIAGGNFSSGTRVFNTPSSGTTYVYLKKATVTDHGTDVGWNNSYGTAQAVFPSSDAVFVIHMPYLSIDGVTGAGTNGYGIVLTTTATTQGSGATIYSYSTAPDYLILSHLECAAPDPNGNMSNFNIDCHVWGGGTGELIQHCYIHGGLVGVLFTGNNQTLDHCYLRNFGNQGHSEAIDACNVNNLTIRYNVLEDLLNPSTTYIEPQVNGGTVPNGIYVYGNVFRAVSANEGSENPSVLSSTSGELVQNVYIYNNTFYGLHGCSPSIGMADTGVRGDNASSTVTVRNNIWQNCVYGPGFQSVQVQDHNMLNTGGASFVNAAAGDFHLVANTTAGVNLGSPYNIDPDGNTRTTWSLGAYEYGSTSTNSAPPAPSGLLGVVLSTTNSASLTIQALGSASWASSLQYNFGDGSYTNFGNANYASAVHTYASTGTYTVTLTASNNVSGLSIPNSQIITITQ